MNRKKTGVIGWMVLLASMVLRSAFIQSSTNYTLKKDAIDQGGSVSTSVNYRVIDAVGQPGPVGTSASAGYSEASGFLAGGIIVSGVSEEVSQAIPGEFKLFQNYPNPFNPETFIGYQLPKPADVELVIYDLNGREVWKMVQKNKPAGCYQTQWDGRDALGQMVGSGVYLYRIEMREKERRHVEVRKMIFMK